MPELKPEEIVEISGLVAKYIQTQREKFLNRGINLPAGLRAEAKDVPGTHPDRLGNR